METDQPRLSDLEIKLGESDGFRRQQVMALSDSLASSTGQLAVLRRRVEELEAEIASMLAPKGE